MINKRAKTIKIFCIDLDSFLHATLNDMLFYRIVTGMDYWDCIIQGYNKSIIEK